MRSSQDLPPSSRSPDALKRRRRARRGIEGFGDGSGTPSIRIDGQFSSSVFFRYRGRWTRLAITVWSAFGIGMFAVVGAEQLGWTDTPADTPIGEMAPGMALAAAIGLSSLWLAFMTRRAGILVEGDTISVMSAMTGRFMRSIRFTDIHLITADVVAGPRTWVMWTPVEKRENTWKRLGAATAEVRAELDELTRRVGPLGQFHLPIGSISTEDQKALELIIAEAGSPLPENEAEGAGRIAEVIPMFVIRIVVGIVLILFLGSVVGFVLG